MRFLIYVFFWLLMGQLFLPKKTRAAWTEQQIDSIRKSLEFVQDTQLANSYIRLASSLFVSDEEAFGYAEKCVSLSEELRYVHGQIRGYYIMGHIKFYFREFEAAIEYYKQGLRVAIDDDNPEDRIKGYSYLPNAFYELSQWDSAHFYNSFLKDEAIEAGDSVLLAVYYGKEADFYFSQSLIELSLQNHIKSSQILELIQDTLGLIRSYGNIAMVLERKGENGDALSYYKKTIRLGVQANDLLAIVPTLGNQAILYREEKKLDSAEMTLNRAMYILDNSEPRIGFDRSTFRRFRHSLIVNSYNLKVDQGKFKEAAALGEGLKNEKLDDYIYSNLLYTLSRAYLGLGQLQKAKELALESLAIQEKYQYFDDLMDTMDQLAQVALAQSDFKQAYAYQQARFALKDSLNETDKQKAYKALLLEYETEKRENEITQLKQKQIASEARRNVLLAGLIGISLTALILILFLRYRASKNKQLLEQGIELDRMKSRFFTQLSHELRTPLTLILGPLEQMKASKEVGSLQPKIELMERNARRLLQLVNQVMDLSKVQAGKLELQAAPTEVNGLVRYIFSSFDSKAEAKRLDYQLHVPSEEIEAYLDQEKFHQIMSNLLSNGCKFVPEGGKLWVRVNEHEKEIEIEVGDNGPGISKMQQAHIFDPYFQGRSPSQVREAGTGIGLALTKEFVELHGGKIRVESEPGNGSRFVLTFLKGKAHLQADQLNDIKKQELWGGYALHDQKKEVSAVLDTFAGEDRPLLLIAEDIPDMQEYLQSVLKGQFRTLFANNGKEALERAKKEMPDLIVSDIMMPEMDGLSFVRALKADKLTDHIPVVFLTAKSSPEDRMEGWESEAQGFLTKPFNPRELQLVIQSVLQSQKKMQLRFQGEVILKPTEVAISSQEAAFLNKLTTYLENHLDNSELSIEELAFEMALSRSQLNRKIKAMTGRTPSLFVRDFRLQRAKQLLEKGFGNVSEVADATGFSSLSYFSKVFAEEFGTAPSQWPESQK